MSTTKKQTVTIPVETVDNFDEYELEDLLRHIHSMITFWNLYEVCPGKFIKDLLEICIEKSVSPSNIIDK